LSQSSNTDRFRSGIILGISGINHLDAHLLSPPHFVGPKTAIIDPGITATNFLLNAKLSKLTVEEEAILPVATSNNDINLLHSHPPPFDTFIITFCIEYVNTNFEPISSR